MRLRLRDLTTVYVRKPQQTVDNEGNIITGGWSDPIEIKMNVQSAGGQVNTQVWGKQLKYIKSCKYQGNVLNENESENWGVCLNVVKTDEPDYLINQVQTYSTHKNITLEKRDQGSDDDG